MKPRAAIFFLVVMLAVSIRVQGQAGSIIAYGYFNYSKALAVYDFNEDPPNLVRTNLFETTTRHLVFNAYANPSGQLKYVICANDGGSLPVGIYDTLGNRYYGDVTKPGYKFIFPLGQKHVLLTLENLLIVNEDNLYDTVLVSKHKLPDYNAYVNFARVFHDTLYLFYRTNDSIQWIKAGPNYISEVQGFSISGYFTQLRYMRNFHHKYFYIDVSKDFRRIALSITHSNGSFVRYPDSMENVLLVADFDLRNNRVKNERILQRNYWITGPGGSLVKNDSFVEKVSLAPNDSILYFVKETQYYEYNAACYRLHLYNNVLERLDTLSITDGLVDFIKAANQKLYYQVRELVSDITRLYEISYPNKEQDEMDIVLLKTFGPDTGMVDMQPSWIGYQDYYQPFIETRVLRHCPGPVFASSHWQVPDSIHYQLYSADSVVVASAWGDTFAPAIAQAGKYHLLTTHYRSGFRQYQWDKYYLDPPITPSFELMDTLTCRFAPLQVRNTTTAQVWRPDQLRYEWKLSGSQTRVYTGFEPEISPPAAGKYLLSLKVATGTCRYQTAPVVLQVQNANPAGFSLSDTLPCLGQALEARALTTWSILDSFRFTVNDQAPVTSLRHAFTPKRAGLHVVGAAAYSRGGCVARHSDTLAVIQGFGPLDSAGIHLVTTTADSLVQLWLAQPPTARAAILLRNGRYLDSVQPGDVLYRDTTAALRRVHAYRLQAMDSCGRALESPVQHNLVLRVRRSDAMTLTMNWNPYPGWPGASYVVEYATNGLDWHTLAETQELGTTASILRFLPEEQVHFRVAATRFLGPVAMSQTALVDIGPALHIPNAFSPNGDGTNDSFWICNYGYAASGVLSVFARTGQVVYQGSLSGAWDGHSAAGLPYSTGAYFYLLKVLTHQGREETHTGVLVLLR